jgi:hypothetical protein
MIGLDTNSAQMIANAKKKEIVFIVSIVVVLIFKSGSNLHGHT